MSDPRQHLPPDPIEVYREASRPRPDEVEQVLRRVQLTLHEERQLDTQLRALPGASEEAAARVEGRILRSWRSGRAVSPWRAGPALTGLGLAAAALLLWLGLAGPLPGRDGPEEQAGHTPVVTPAATPAATPVVAPSHAEPAPSTEGLAEVARPSEAPPREAARLGDVQVAGRLEGAEARRRLQSALGGLEACLAEVPGRPRLEVSVAVGGGGEVSGVRARGEGASSVEPCLASVLRGLRFDTKTGVRAAEGQVLAAGGLVRFTLSREEPR